MMFKCIHKTNIVSQISCHFCRSRSIFTSAISFKLLLRSNHIHTIHKHQTTFLTSKPSKVQAFSTRMTYKTFTIATITIAYLGSLTFQLSNVITVLGHVNVMGSTLHLSYHGHFRMCTSHPTPPGEVEEKIKRSAFICTY